MRPLAILALISLVSAAPASIESAATDLTVRNTAAGTTEHGSAVARDQGEHLIQARQTYSESFPWPSAKLVGGGGRTWAWQLDALGDGQYELLLWNVDPSPRKFTFRPIGEGNDGEVIEKIVPGRTLWPDSPTFRVQRSGTGFEITSVYLRD
ncbi:hypothetical protein ACJZ2D_016472 [Fusarium nematophilum]